jgi:hypothetical protein
MPVRDASIDVRRSCPAEDDGPDRVVMCAPR